MPCTLEEMSWVLHVATKVKMYFYAFIVKNMDELQVD